MLKYRFANDSSENLIDIGNVDKNNKGIYRCIYCKDELNARIGEHRVRHFSHKPDANCSTESYLHVLGKTLFYQYYKKCLQTRNPFFIDIKKEKTCISCSQIETLNTDVECIQEVSELFDLTNWFNEIYWEKGSDGFVADLLLKSNKHTEVIFIEIAVTHKCEKKKLISGNRIIEVELKSDTDIDLLSLSGLKLGDERIKYYNFKLKQEREKYYNPRTCKNKHKVFAITKRRKPILADIPVNSLLENIEKEKYLYYHILNKVDLEMPNSQFIRKKIKQLFLDGLFLRECLLCHFSTPIEYSQNKSIKLFCQLHYEKLPMRYKESPCRQYRPDSSLQPFLKKNYIDDNQILYEFDSENVSNVAITQEQIDRRRDEFEEYYNQKELGYNFNKVMVKQIDKHSFIEYVDCPKMKVEYLKSQVAIGKDYVKLEVCEKCKNYRGISRIEKDIIVCNYNKELN